MSDNDLFDQRVTSIINNYKKNLNYDKFLNKVNKCNKSHDMRNKSELTEWQQNKLASLETADATVSNGTRQLDMPTIDLSKNEVTPEIHQIYNHNFRLEILNTPLLRSNNINKTIIKHINNGCISYSIDKNILILTFSLNNLNAQPLITTRQYIKNLSLIHYINPWSMNLQGKWDYHYQDIYKYNLQLEYIDMSTNAGVADNFHNTQQIKLRYNIAKYITDSEYENIIKRN